MSSQEDVFTKNFTVILVVVVCGIVGVASFEQFAGKTVISAEETAANIKPVGQVTISAPPAEVASVQTAVVEESAKQPESTEPAPTASETESPASVETPQESAPAAEEAAPSETNSAPATEASAEESDLEIANGEEIYKSACFVCHDSGASGAPKIGDSADWAPRIAQGIDVMAQHAIEGFTGTKGMMPPKGGRMDLPDEDVKNAVSYIVSKSQ